MVEIQRSFDIGQKERRFRVVGRKKDPGSGRPKVTSERTDREIKRVVGSKKKENVSKITRDLQDSLGDDAPSRWTVARRA